MSEMTMRDQFAMAALTGLMASGEKVPQEHLGIESYREAVARAVYAQADAMLKARETSPND